MNEVRDVILYFKKYIQEYIEKIYSDSISTIIDNYDPIVELVDSLTDIYSELTMYDASVVEFFI